METVELYCSQQVSRIRIRFRSLAGRIIPRFKPLVRKVCIYLLCCVGFIEVTAQNKWIVPENPGSKRHHINRLRSIVTERSKTPNPNSGHPLQLSSSGHEDKDTFAKIEGAFGIHLGETVKPDVRLFHDRMRGNAPYFNIFPEQTLTSEFMVDYQVLLTFDEKRVAMIKAKCILNSIHDVRPFSQHVQHYILTKYGTGHQRVQTHKHGGSWYYFKPGQPHVFIRIEAVSTSGIVMIQYGDEQLLREIEKEMLDRRFGKLNLSAL